MSKAIEASLAHKRDRKSLPPYQCFRCGYETSQKNAMRRHLFKIKPCPGILVDVELTEDIKTKVLDNRVFHHPKPADEIKILNQSINQYNTINNFVTGLDPLHKLTEFAAYKNMQMIPLERCVEIMFENTCLPHQKTDDDIGSNIITHDDMIGAIDHISQVQHKEMDDFNIICDSKQNKILMYENALWKEYIPRQGLKKLFELMQDYKWNGYECHLIRKLERGTLNAFKKDSVKSLLDDFYKFLALNNIAPFVKDRSNNQIMYDVDDDLYWNDTNFSSTYSDYYYSKFSKILRDTTNAQKEKMGKEILDIIKRNGKNNLYELEQQLIPIIKMDPNFQKILEDPKKTQHAQS